MSEKSEIRDVAERVRARFEKAGALAVDADVLQPAGTLLDLYGEDIRARAYVTTDPVRGEMMLRPDFTVPLVQMHLESVQKPMRYSYLGEVFRKQEYDVNRNPEHLQVGFELLGHTARAETDAEVFALFYEILSPLGFVPTIGDMGLLRTAVLGLETTDTRKAALMRHLWRPGRFKKLLRRFVGEGEERAERAALLSLEDPLGSGVREIGKRSRGEVLDRIARLRADADAPAISVVQADVLLEIAGLTETAPNVLSRLRDLTVDLPALVSAADLFAARLDALDAKGIAVDGLKVEGSFSRITIEYYDGFVFAFADPSDPVAPPAATGGRYDALTRVLGKGADVPAVGGVIRPERLLAAGGAS